MTATYLELHPPASQQFRARHGDPSGAFVIHDAECATDLNGPDTAAEAVAHFIAGRTDPGCYHSISDSDSTVELVDIDLCAYHCGAGGNDWSIGLSVATRYDAWPTLPAQWIDGALHQLATSAATKATRLQATHGIVVPARRISVAQYYAREPGFISHAELDPRRRKDPGPGFPWTEFLTLFTVIRTMLTNPQEADDMFQDLGNHMGTIRSLYLAHRGQLPSLEEEASWAGDAVRRIRAGEGVIGTTPGQGLEAAADYVDWALGQEPGSRIGPR